MDVTKPYKYIGFGDIHGPKTYKSTGFGDIHGPKPYEFIGFRWAFTSQTPVVLDFARDPDRPRILPQRPQSGYLNSAAQSGPAKHMGF